MAITPNLGKSIGTEVAPDERAAERALRTILRAHRERRFGSPLRRDLRLALYAMLDPTIEEKLDVTLTDAFIRYHLNAVVDRCRRAGLRTLVSAYLLHFTQRSRQTRKAADVLGRVADRLTEIWRDRVDKYQLFNLEFAPVRLADEALAVANPQDLLRLEVGLGAPEGVTGMSAVALDHAIRNYPKGTGLEDLIVGAHALVSWIRPSAGAVEQHPRGAAVIEAILQPWLNKTPTAELRDLLAKLLVGTFGDPRLSKRTWARISEPARGIIMRWLASSSLELFFHAIDQSADPRMWKRRKLFWSAYIKEGLVSDAWVALGSDAMRRIRSSIEDSDDGAPACAILHAGPRDLSMMIMRIDTLIVTEGSHNKKVRFWHDETKAPSLYRKEYTVYDLMKNCDYDRRHDTSGYWMTDIAQHITRETGVVFRPLVK